jgi:hypothetical protein
MEDVCLFSFYFNFRSSVIPGYIFSLTINNHDSYTLLKSIFFLTAHTHISLVAYSCSKTISTKSVFPQPRFLAGPFPTHFMRMEFLARLLFVLVVIVVDVAVGCFPLD